MSMRLWIPSAKVRNNAPGTTPLPPGKDKLNLVVASATFKVTTQSNISVVERANGGLEGLLSAITSVPSDALRALGVPGMVTSVVVGGVHAKSSAHRSPIPKGTDFMCDAWCYGHSVPDDCTHSPDARWYRVSSQSEAVLFPRSGGGAATCTGPDYHKPVKTFPDRGGYRAYGWKGQGMSTVHNGEDYWAEVGSKVCAMLDGDVVLSAELGGFGSLNPSTPGGCIIVKHQFANGASFYAIYGHLVRRAQLNQKVKRGDLLGTIRDFSNAGAVCPHLHLGINTGPACPTSHLGYAPSLDGYPNPVPWLNDNATMSKMLGKNGVWEKG